MEGALVLAGVDLGDAVQAAAAMAAVGEKYGRIDALLNIAGGFVWEKIERQDPSRWSDLFRLNVVTAANASRAAIPHLRKSAGGRIVNVGSAAALKAGVGMGAYAAAKSGVHALTQSLAEELKGDGITVNAVLPSIIDTPANRADMPDVDPGDLGRARGSRRGDPVPGERGLDRGDRLPGAGDGAGLAPRGLRTAYAVTQKPHRIF